jgi:FtsZ-interacting cell division protein ZipA
MTELQMGLIGLGASAVVGVLAYNKWQEHKHRRLAEKMLKAQHEDVLLENSAHEEATEHFASNGADAPGALAANVGLAAHAVAERVEPSMEPLLRLDPRLEELVPSREEPLARQFPASPEPLSGSVPQTSQAVPMPVSEPAPARSADEVKEARESVQPLHLLSPVIDYVASFEAVEPAPAYQILESQRDALARVRKPVHWIGYNERSREWEPIIDDGDSEYRRIRIGLQLVDRHGPARDGDLSTFHVAMQDLSDELMAIVDLPPRQPALEAAAKLDEFCAGVDIQIGINVISQGQVFPGTKLRALAEAAGMAIDSEGRFVRCDDDGNVLYMLTNQEAAGFSAESMKTMSTHGVTFLLDVPRVSHGDRVFNQMLDLARRFAEALHGSLVDDNRRPLSEGALEPIRRQVAQYQAVMAARNLPAGGPLALRLFS